MRESITCPPPVALLWRWQTPNVCRTDELVEHAHHDHDGFLLLGEQFLEFALGLSEVLASLFAGVAEGGELGLDLFGLDVLVVQRGAQLVGSLLNGRRLGIGIAAAAAAESATTATTTATRGAAATTAARAAA